VTGGAIAATAGVSILILAGEPFAITKTAGAATLLYVVAALIGLRLALLAVHPTE
jgi:hypothetical protein